jgi:hypothetical protein
MTKLKDLLKEFDSVSDKEAKTPFGKLKDKDIDNDGKVNAEDSYLHKKLGTVALKTEEEIDEARVPDNIKNFAKRKGASALVNKVAGWAEKSGKRIYAGTAIGKNYSTLVLDFGYDYDGAIRINLDDDTVELYGEEVKSFNEFKSVLAKESMNEQSTSDVVTFSIDDDKLDQLLHDKFSDHIDYIDDDHLDSYYTMPQRQFDRFIDAADSRGFNTDELIRMNEMSTTAGAPGYETPFAFGAADDETMDQAGYKKVKTKKNESTYKQMMNQLHEMRYSEYKNDTTATPKTKVNKSISEVNRLLGEIEKIVHRNMRLKTEEGVNSSDYWKNTSKNFGKISERLVRINNKLRELSQ